MFIKLLNASLISSASLTSGKSALIVTFCSIPAAADSVFIWLAPTPANLDNTSAPILDVIVFIIFKAFNILLVSSAFNTISFLCNKANLPESSPQSPVYPPVLYPLNWSSLNHPYAESFDWTWIG